MPGLSVFLPPDFLIPDGQRLGWRAYVILGLLCLAFFLPGLTTIPPVDRDEPHFAQATKQMIETGNYVDIRFQQDTRYQKPIGIYWLQAASVKFLSPHRLDAIWAYRVPSLTGATVSVLMTAAIGSLLFGPLAGFVAALLMACCLLLNVEARLAKTDSFLLACVLVAQYALARAYLQSVTLPLREGHNRAGDCGEGSQETPSPAKTNDLLCKSKVSLPLPQGERETLGWPVFLAFWIAQGVGFLIKGPLLLLVTLATLLYLKITEKRIGWVKSLRPALAIPLALLITAPWFVAIMLASHGGFAAQSGGHDLLAKIWQGQDRGIMPPGLHLLVFPAMFFPGSLFALMALPGVWMSRNDPRVRFCLGWILIPWLVFELSLTKLPHYVLPVYPAISILAAAMMLKGFPGIAERRWRWLGVVAFGAWLLVGMGIALAVVFVPLLTDHSVSSSAIVAGVLLLAMQGAVFVLLAVKSPKSLLVLTGGSLLFTLLAFGSVIPSLQHVWLTRQIMQVAENVKPCAKVEIISAAYNEPSLIFMAGTDTAVTNVGREVAARMQQDSCLLGLVGKEYDATFLNQFNESSMKPVALAHLDGPNIGNSKHAELTLYRLTSGESRP